MYEAYTDMNLITFILCFITDKIFQDDTLSFGDIHIVALIDKIIASGIKLVELYSIICLIHVVL